MAFGRGFYEAWLLRGLPLTFPRTRCGADQGFDGSYASRLALAILIKVSAALRSSLRKAAKPSGVVVAETTTFLARKAMNSGSVNSVTNAALSLSTIARGVPFGTARPHQPWPG